MTESRDYARQQVMLAAWIEQAGGLLPCTLSNISAAGAQLCVSADFALPARFPIRMHEDGKVRRGCRVIWRKDDRTGVRFFPLAELA